MLTEPLTVTIDTVAKSLPRVAVGDRRATYENVADGIQLSVTHANGKRDRSTIRLDITKTAADPLLDGVSRQYGMSAYTVVDRPKVGFTVAEISDNVQGLLSWLADPTNLAKVVGGES